MDEQCGGDASYRLTWRSAAAEAEWEPKIVAARAERCGVLLDALLQGACPAVIFPLAPYDLPAAMAKLLGTDAELAVLDGDPPGVIVRLFPRKWAPSDVWCCAAPALRISALKQAWTENDLEAFAHAADLPACCVERARARRSLHDAEWELMTGSAATESAEARFHLLRIGVMAGAYLPCTSACMAARDTARFAGDATRELLQLPVAWSACNGITEVITPPFRLIHNCPSEPDSEGVRRSFYLPPSQKGAELPIGYGAVERRPLGSIDALPDHPVFFANMGKEWPALTRWTPDYLIERLGPAQVNHLLEPKRVRKFLSFAEFLESFLSGGRYAGRYLFSFPFSVHAPALQNDYNLPNCFYSWLSLIPDGSVPAGREMFMGQAGTKTPLHQEALNTDFWMAVIWGRKRWALCPPNSDASLLEGSPNLFDPGIERRLRDRGVSILFCEQDPGDLLFVPNRWWHQVENVAPTLGLSEVMVHEGNAEIILARLGEVKEELPAHVARGFKRAIELGRQASRSGCATRSDALAPG